MACSAGYHKSAFFFRCYYLGHFDQPLVAQGDIDYLECVMARIAPGTYLDRNGESVVISPDFPVKVLTFGPSSGPLVFDSLRGQAVSQPVLEGEILVETAAGKKLFLRPYHHDNACVGEQVSIPPDHVFSLDDAALQVVSGHYFPEVALRLGLSEATAKAKLRIRLRLFVSLVWQAGMASFRPKQMPSKWDDCITTPGKESCGLRAIHPRP